MLSDSVKNITEIITFYEILSELYVYFSSSLPKWQELKEHTAKNKKGIIPNALKKLCPTRWSSRFDTISATKKKFFFRSELPYYYCFISYKKER